MAPHPIASPTPNQQIASLALPALGYMVVEPLVSLCDTAFIGQLGGDRLAALGVAAQLFTAAFIVSNFLTHESNALIARAEAHQDHQASRSIAARIMTVAWALSIVAATVIISCAAPLLSLFDVSAPVAALASEYTRIRALSAPAVFTMIAGHGIFRGLQDTKTLLRASLLLNLINLGLDPLFIFVFELDIAGAAWATVIAQYAGAAYVVTAYQRRLGWSWPAWRRQGQSPLDPGFRGLLGSGGVLTIRTGLLLLTLLLATRLASALGTEALAAQQIALQLWFFSVLAVDALAVAGQSLVARHIGLGDLPAALAINNRLLVLGLLLGCAFGLFFALAHGYLPAAFTTAEATEVRQLCSEALMVIAIGQPIGALTFVWDGFFLGRRDFNFLALVMFGAAAGAVGCMLTLYRDYRLEGIWWGLTLFLLLRTGPQLFVYMRLIKNAQNASPPPMGGS